VKIDYWLCSRYSYPVLNRKTNLLHSTMSGTEGFAVTFLIARKTDISLEEFTSLYTQHMRDVNPIMKRHGCSAYVVQLNSPEAQAKMMSAMGIPHGGANMEVAPEHDAVASMTFPDALSFESFMIDVDHKYLLERDGPRMTDTKKTKVYAGEVREVVL
jgi:hypothetical protein